MTIYDITFFVFSLAYLPYLLIKGKAHKDFAERFGKLPCKFREAGASRPLWVHAVSVGEVIAVKNFVDTFSKKYPERKIVFSTTTETGNAIARKILREDIPKFFFPLDFSFIVRRFVETLNPSAVVIMETEIWPNLILELWRRRLPVAVINGRISDKSFGGYKKIKFFFGEILKKVTLFCVQTEKDAGRIMLLGAPEENVKITGNMKYDTAESEFFSARDDKGHAFGIDAADDIRNRLGIDKSNKLIIAGSTHKGEEGIILEAYSDILSEDASVKLIIAPRHIDRTDSIKKLASGYGFKGIPTSEVCQAEKAGMPPGKTVFILDTIGELSRLYSLATVVFIGGSLVRRGGHNIIEPAIFAKPIVFGPNMFNFRDITGSFLENDAAIQVNDKNTLLEALRLLLKNEERRAALSGNAKRLIDGNRGATERNVNEVAGLIAQKAAPL
ncbi:MAG: 3-deoxy-D-manno-octulosonic acid transferase [Candidatus Omnitrophica bacterium]|nr:3-deoxy-D-manno-octulosonic acid transferase [Candidatus Omnitrophota bacterium]